MKTFYYNCSIKTALYHLHIKQLYQERTVDCRYVCVKRLYNVKIITVLRNIFMMFVTVKSMLDPQMFLKQVCNNKTRYLL